MSPDDTPSDAALATVRELVANNPGLTGDELAGLVRDGSVTITADAGLDPDAIPDLLDAADVRDLVLEADSKYWVMRTGAYAPEHRDYDVDRDQDLAGDN